MHPPGVARGRVIEEPVRNDDFPTQILGVRRQDDSQERMPFFQGRMDFPIDVLTLPSLAAAKDDSNRAASDVIFSDKPTLVFGIIALNPAFDGRIEKQVIFLREQFAKAVIPLLVISMVITYEYFSLWRSNRFGWAPSFGKESRGCKLRRQVWCL